MRSLTTTAYRMEACTEVAAKQTAQKVRNDDMHLIMVMCFEPHIQADGRRDVSFARV